jgi:hypothetical protein
MASASALVARSPAAKPMLGAKASADSIIAAIKLTFLIILSSLLKKMN